MELPVSFVGTFHVNIAFIVLKLHILNVAFCQGQSRRLEFDVLVYDFGRLGAGSNSNDVDGQWIREDLAVKAR